MDSSRSLDSGNAPVPSARSEATGRTWPIYLVILVTCLLPAISRVQRSFNDTLEQERLHPRGYVASLRHDTLEGLQEGQTRFQRLMIMEPAADSGTEATSPGAVQSAGETPVVVERSSDGSRIRWTYPGEPDAEARETYITLPLPREVEARSLVSHGMPWQLLEKSPTGLRITWRLVVDPLLRPSVELPASALKPRAEDPARARTVTSGLLLFLAAWTVVLGCKRVLGRKTPRPALGLTALLVGLATFLLHFGPASPTLAAWQTSLLQILMTGAGCGLALVAVSRGDSIGIAALSVAGIFTGTSLMSMSLSRPGNPEVVSFFCVTAFVYSWLEVAELSWKWWIFSILAGAAVFRSIPQGFSMDPEILTQQFHLWIARPSVMADGNGWLTANPILVPALTGLLALFLRRPLRGGAMILLVIAQALLIGSRPERQDILYGNPALVLVSLPLALGLAEFVRVLEARNMRWFGIAYVAASFLVNLRGYIHQHLQEASSFPVRDFDLGSALASFHAAPGNTLLQQFQHGIDASSAPQIFLPIFLLAALGIACLGTWQLFGSSSRRQD